jgi:hypothetical protein
MPVRKVIDVNHTDQGGGSFSEPSMHRMPGCPYPEDHSSVTAYCTAPRSALH